MDKSSTEHKQGGLTELPATAICGNDITSSCLYVSALAIIQAGKWAWLAARGRSTFSELRWYPPMEAAKGSLSWVFRAKQPESVRTGP